MRNINKKQNLVEQARINLDKEKNLHQITKYKVEKLETIIKEVREMLEHKVEFHKNLDFYKDKELETQVYYNYVACLQDFDEIIKKYKVEEKK